MKMRESNTKVHRTEDFEESHFGIDNDEDLVHIFSILRSKIYTDKVKAVIREYSTNAQDAHIEAGTPDRPIDVSIPTRFSPEFSVRDYGSGLTDQEVRSVYVKYGKSTKRNSNDFNGQLGLGCKSGFAYGDSFLITSFKDGVKTDFEAYIDETKIGKVAKLKSSETDEPNGIKITIPVKPQDTDAFIRTAQQFYAYFTPLPHAPGLQIPKLTPKYSGTGWSINSRDKYSGLQGTPVAVMGNVVYPIDMSILDKNTPTKYKDIVHRMRNIAIVCTFDIGSLSIASSREGLEYDKETIRTIVEKFEFASSELKEEIEKDFHNIKSIFDARQKYHDFFESYDTRHTISQMIPNREIVWKGHKIKSSNFEWGISRDKSYASGYTIDLDGSKVLGISQRRLERWSTWRHKTSVPLVLNDTTDRWILRLRNLLESNPSYSAALVFKFEDNQEGREAFKQFKERNCLENVHFIKLSSYEPLKKPKTGPTVRPPKHKAKVFEFDPTSTSDKSEAWVVSDKDIKAVTGHYIVLDRFVPTLNNRSISNKELVEFLNATYTLLGIDFNEDLIGVKKAIADKIAKKWPKLEDKIIAVVEKKIEDPNLLEMLSIKTMIDNHSTNNIISYVYGSDMWKNIKPQHDGSAKYVFTLLERFDTFKKENKNMIEAIEAISLRLNLTSKLSVTRTAKIEEIAQKFKVFQEKYPMIVYGLTWETPTVKAIEDYIDLLDTRSKNNA